MKINFTFLFLIYFQVTSCQDYGELKLIEHLPETLEEISGMESIKGSELLLAINDSGNAPNVYLYDFNKGLYTIAKDGLKNEDWEDLTIYEDSTLGKRFLYIGDFGNNNNEREDLAIYKIDLTSLDLNNLNQSSIEKIPFYYNTQQEFPPSKKERYYDCEAFIRVGSYFYLFSKNRSNDFNGKTQVYKLKADGSSTIAEYINEIEICNDDKDCLITSADINSNGEIALLTSDKIFMISDYDADFKDFKIKRYELNHNSQKESIIFKTDNILWISDEQRKNTGGNLYEYKLKN